MLRHIVQRSENNLMASILSIHLYGSIERKLGLPRLAQAAEPPPRPINTCPSPLRLIICMSVCSASLRSRFYSYTSTPAPKGRQTSLIVSRVNQYKLHSRKSPK